ncbi:hypothetical protein DE146DRAFT_450538 [Phaeosphaeria sp. MPI-PUGE-AT-0046c]|nr:hypothetical protein DE146DRAFT_450538 [Phaeosphaeria sp. MPI-PUGE-AT-0046c]
MATEASHEHQNKQYLPPSPPPSPHSARRRHRKRNDSFEKLANTPMPSPPSSPSQGPVADEDKDSLIGKIILTPVLFVSFILSLTFVNFRDRVNRTRSNSGPSILAYLSPSNWLDLEPYQNPHDSTWGLGDSAGHVEPKDAISPKEPGQDEIGAKKRKKSWHLNKKIRKVAKLEVSDAFEMRGKFIAAMLAMMVLGSVFLWISITWLFTTTTKMFYGAKQ